MSLFAAFGVGIIFVFVFMVIISGLFMWFAAMITASSFLLSRGI